MANILSLQSHVAFGHVGNRAALFPLERMGNEVIAINTVQFSNHTGYGSWTGDIMSIEHIDSIFKGLMERGVLNNLDALLTGYLGDPLLGAVFLKWHSQILQLNPNLVYCCDPVIGDTDRGIFVRPGVPEFFQQQAIPAASILTPNQFELSNLTGISITTLASAQQACQILHERGVKQVLVTSLTRDDAPHEQIEMMLSSEDGAYLVATPRLALAIAPNGAGDLTAAVFLAKWLETRNPKYSLEHTAAAVYSVFLATQQLERRELALIQAQDYLLVPQLSFSAHKIS